MSPKGIFMFDVRSLPSIPFCFSSSSPAVDLLFIGLWAVLCIPQGQADVTLRREERALPRAWDGTASSGRPTCSPNPQPPVVFRLCQLKSSMIPARSSIRDFP